MIGIEEATETLYANTAKDTENVALVFVEFWRCFSAEE